MNLFLTGITGFCGSHIGQRLERAGHSVWALTRCGSRPVFDGDGGRGITVLPGDLISAFKLPAGIDAIIHAAAKSPVPGVAVSDFIETNIVGTQHLLRLAADAGVRKFILLSSLSIYGEIRVPVVTENTPIVNPGVYGASKLLCEFLLRDQPREFASIALRLPGVLGRGASRHWLATLALQARGGREITIFNPDAPFNNAVHIDDLADLIEVLLAREWQGFDAVTLGAGGELSIAQIAERVVQSSGARAAISVVPAVQPAFTISSQRARTVYGYKPMDFSAMLTRYLSEI